MFPQSQPYPSNPSSRQGSDQLSVGGKMEPLVDADTTAEFLQVSRRRTLELARRGVLPGHPLGIDPPPLVALSPFRTCSPRLGGRVQCKRQSHVPRGEI